MIGGSAGVGGVPGPWYLSLPEGDQEPTLAQEVRPVRLRPQRLGHPVRASAWPPGSLGLREVPGQDRLRGVQAADRDPRRARRPSRPATAKWQQIVDTVLVPMLQKAVAGGRRTPGLLADAKTQDREPRQLRRPRPAPSGTPAWRCRPRPQPAERESRAHP